MKSFCIIGLDTFGQTLALTLTQNGHQVMIIDENAEAVNALADVVTNAVIGDPTNESVLRAADVKQYDCAVICTSDNINDSILITLSLKDMGIPKVVARAVSDQHKRVLEKIGADQVVFPERDMGEKLAYMLDKNNVMDYIEFSSEYSIVEIKVPLSWVGKTLLELDVRKRFKVNVIAVTDQRTGKISISPAPDRPFDPMDLVSLIGLNVDIDKTVKNM